MRRWFLGFALGSALLGTAGCTELTLATVDAKMSELADADCHYTQLLLTGAYCRSRTVAAQPTSLYCFRSIGGVDCYDQRDPYDIDRSGRALQAMPLQAPSPAAPLQAKAGQPSVATTETAALPPP